VGFGNDGPLVPGSTMYDSFDVQMLDLVKVVYCIIPTRAKWVDDIIHNNNMLRYIHCNKLSTLCYRSTRILHPRVCFASIKDHCWNA
jgi:hypothetical protein